MKKTLLAAIIATTTPIAAQADLLFTVGAKANAWTAEPSGQVDEGVSADSETDGLGLDSDSGTNLTVFIEHPVPMLPNIRLRQTSIDFEGSGNVEQEFNGIRYNGDVDSFMDLSHTDATLFWGLPLPLPYIDVNFGITARMFDGEVIVEDTTIANIQREEVQLDFTIPMGFLEAKLETPFGVYAQAEVNAIGYDGNSLTDTVVALGFDLPVPVVDLGLEVGQRSMSMKTNKDTTDIETDLDVSGIFYGASLAVGF